MSCPPEWRYAVYVDGELPAPEARRLDAHLVQCRACRALVVALRDEVTLLADALQDRETAPPARARPRAPARGLATGMVPALAFGAAALTLAGWVLEALVPSSLDWLNPLRLLGAYDMIFDLVFLLRDEAPGLIEFLVAVAAMSSVAALLTFAFGALSRRLVGSLLVLLALLLQAGAGRALDLRLDEEFVRIAKGETIAHTLVVTGEELDLDGVVEGDLVAFVDRLSIRGEVRGNVFAAARALEVPGRVAGSLYGFYERIGVSGEIAGSVYTVSELSVLDGEGSVGRDAVQGGRDVVVEGAVGRDVLSLSDNLQLRGRVARNVAAHVRSATVGGGAHVGGDLDLEYAEEEGLGLSPEATIQGETRTHLHERHFESPFEHYARASYYLWLAVWIAGALLVGVLLHVLLPGLFEELELATAGAFGRSLAVGFVALIAAPVAILLAALTVAGIPAALIALALYVSALYVAGILVAALVGAAILRPESDAPASFGLTLLVGLLVLTAATSLPFLGFLVEILALLTGLGLLVDRARAGWRATRADARLR